MASSHYLFIGQVRPILVMCGSSRGRIAFVLIGTAPLSKGAIYCSINKAIAFEVLMLLLAAAMKAARAAETACLPRESPKRRL